MRAIAPSDPFISDISESSDDEDYTAFLFNKDKHEVDAWVIAEDCENACIFSPNKPSINADSSKSSNNVDSIDISLDNEPEEQHEYEIPTKRRRGRSTVVADLIAIPSKKQKRSS